MNTAIKQSCKKNMMKVPKKGYKKFIIKTDASVVNGKSSHGYKIGRATAVHKSGKHIGKRDSQYFRYKTFSTLISDIQMAELYSIECALLEAQKMGIKSISVKTDNLNIVNCINGDKEPETSFQKQCEIVKRLLNRLDSKIDYNPRELNTGMDKACKRENKMKKIDWRFRKAVRR